MRMNVLSFNLCGARGCWARVRACAASSTTSFTSTIQFFSTSRKIIKGQNFLDEPQILFPSNSNSNKESPRSFGSPFPRPRQFFQILPFSTSLSSFFFHNSTSVNVYSYPLFQQRQTFQSSTFQLFVSESSLSKNMSPQPDTVEETKKTETDTEVEVTTASTPMETEIVAVAGAEPQVKLLFAKLTENASAPTKGSKFAAGYDLMSAYDSVVPKRGSALIKTDIQIQLPIGTYGRIAPRSGLALKNKIDVGAGVVDGDYRGNVGVVLFNHSDDDFVVTKGDRIAQLICEKISYPEVEEVKTLDESVRGEQGFGSTGVKKIKLDEEETAKAKVDATLA